MKAKNRWIVVFIGLSQVLACLAQADQGTVPLDKVKNQLCDKASLQQGMALYMNYCSGCHSLKYARFEDVAKDIGLVDSDGQVLEQLVNENLNFLSDKITSPL